MKWLILNLDLLYQSTSLWVRFKLILMMQNWLKKSSKSKATVRSYLMRQNQTQVWETATGLEMVGCSFTKYAVMGPGPVRMHLNFRYCVCIKQWVP